MPRKIHIKENNDINKILDVLILIAISTNRWILEGNSTVAMWALEIRSDQEIYIWDLQMYDNWAHVYGFGELRRE